ncbi:procathepsin L-like [Sitodiplosis mosellana]|uniref:procathepsin L-like n=1 Tax=Sitodiplosis mosellana TaxID=263140 RepID=UPI002443F5FB|nr:procathepsin L-like [Sitodiplosis mosellana]
MARLFLILTVISGVMVFIDNVSTNDAEFGRIITFDNFDHFKASMDKKYHHNHMEKRARTAYDKNMQRIVKHNEEARKGKYSFEIRANNMADMTREAYLRRFIRLKQDIHPESVALNEAHERIDAQDHEALLGSVHHEHVNEAFIPDALDWRELGFKTKPLNQRTCGSCYAFSLATSIAGQVFRRTGKVVELSPQQIVDCSISMGNSGCTGGSLRTTLRYLQSSRGLMRDVDYSYESEQQNCQYKPSLAVVNVTRWAILPHKNEEAMKKAIALVGPIPISINAHPYSFQLYSHGIYEDSECHDKSVNHAMLAVGYTPDYFILQNWWGDKWGENGYMKIRRGVNMCGISNYAAYALV